MQYIYPYRRSLPTISLQIFLLAVLVLINLHSTRAQHKHITTLQPIPANVTGTPRSSLMNINNITMWASDNGMLERQPSDQTAGVGFPRGTASVIYAGGLVWGGLVKDGQQPLLRVGGQTYNIGTVPGAIIRPGIGENPENDGVRIYRIRRDWATADLRQDAAEFFGIPTPEVTQDEIQTLREQYRKDWVEWPWQKGAPFYDRDGVPGYQAGLDGLYDPSRDEPGLGGADQVIWFVANDLDVAATRRLYGSPPIGLELQVTCWAYSHPKELANVIFQRYRLIYKGTAQTPSTAVIDSMYLGKWADTDIGDYADDYVGYSVERSLGYAYNADNSDSKYADFSLVPPVAGYDLFQGPRVKQLGSKAHWDLKSVQGYANLPATVFTYFTQDSRTTDFLFSNYTATREWWNLLRGYRAEPLLSPQCFRDPIANACTTFELPGDPQALHGWVDGRIDRAGDRRILLGSGPFSMVLGDTQEVVVGLLAALGKDNRAGIGVLEETDNAAQDLFNIDFDRLDPIPVPPLRIVELENRVILDWEKDTAAVSAIEHYNSKGFTFETYKIYQFPLPTSQPSQAIVLPPFDPFSSPRFLDLTTDLIRNRPLINGQNYYYAITTVVYTADQSFAQPRLESPIVIKTATPHSPNPGVVYPYEIGEVVPGIFDYVGVNDAVVEPVYFDPSKPDSHIYKILFRISPDPITAFNEKPKWSLIDSTTNDTLIRRVSVDLPPQRVITRGLTMKVTGVPFFFKGVFAVEEHGLPTRQSVFDRPDVDSTFLVATTGSSQIDSLKGGNPKDTDVELRFTGDSSWTAFIGDLPRSSRWVRVPFTAWELRVTKGDTVYHQVYTCVTEAGNDSVWRPNAHLGFSFRDTPLRFFYPITITTDSLFVDVRYLGGTYDDSIVYRSYATITKTYLWTVGLVKTRYNLVWKAAIADLDEDGTTTPPGTIIRFERYHQINDKDEKLFIPTAVTNNNVEAARREIERITVFPNPYYGMNRAEVDRVQRFMTFSHLPHNAVIRIFNLAGELVKTIRKDGESQFTRWDLNNETGLPIAGGIYLAHLELSDVAGKSLGEKTLKLMIVREEQTLGN
ncbi:MAG: hypothetical protein HY033_03285 [Ignavibacteriae bacterium]|nr:hypothetical protein [Ignavibacteria bacterium]MBI3363912.1 hypothetical protein [Ignavibacteriota bacterium]